MDLLILIALVIALYYYIYVRITGWEKLTDGQELSKCGITFYEIRQHLNEKGIKTKTKIIKNEQEAKEYAPLTTALMVRSREFEDAQNFLRSYKIRS